MEKHSKQRIVYVNNPDKAKSWEKQVEKNYEPSDNLSQTIPNQAMSVKEILKRHAAGLSVGSPRVELWDGEDDLLPDLSKYDKADRVMIMQDFALMLKEKKEKIKQDLLEEVEKRKQSEKTQKSQEITEDIEHEEIAGRKRNAISDNYEKNFKGQRKSSKNDD